ncbi:hypothetical protein Ahy_B08g091112 [Arachis hypogaea]|uniref:ATP-dependent DNA helicase n=1 Tax=Arachis hypogaea TaxID=3818 RepID=A0A444Y1F2_ARAHY|nr:hypothetical protein Ahy_B08g091112 [Arachis hypogaea]
MGVSNANYESTLFVNRDFWEVQEFRKKDIETFVLSNIEDIMHSYRKSLQEYPPMSIPSGNEQLIIEELKYDRHQLEILTSSMLCMKKAYDRVTKTVNESEGGFFFFLYDHGGCCKTFFYNLMLVKVRSEGKTKVLNVIANEITSLLLLNSKTTHSRFKISITVDKYSMCNIRQGSPLAKLLIRTHLIIWDKAPMLSRCLRDIMRHALIANGEHPFRGKVVVFGGDFSPMIIRGS